MKIILASASPRRKDILNMVGMDFEVLVTDADEKTDLPSEPDKLVCELAKRKNLAARSHINESDSIVISADTIVWHDGRVLTKPKDKLDAEKMLFELSDSTHFVYSGVCISNKDKKRVFHVATGVKMRALTKEEIDAYIATGEPLDKAGAYGIQELGGMFVEEIHGDFYNVVGLPLEMCCKVLREDFNYNVLLER